MASVAFISNGMVSAADTACTSRPVSSSPNEGAVAQISDPARKVPSVTSVSRRVSSHCTRLAVSGARAPITSRKPVAIHCTVVFSTENSLISVGKATLSRVSFRKPMKAPTNSVLMTSVLGKDGSSSKYSYWRDEGKDHSRSSLRKTGFSV